MSGLFEIAGRILSPTARHEEVFSSEVMRDALVASRTEIVTVAPTADISRKRDPSNILDFIDPKGTAPAQYKGAMDAVKPSASPGLRLHGLPRWVKLGVTQINIATRSHRNLKGCRSPCK
jgi:thiazole synthase ThiGH ThiG subunit